MSTCRVVRPRQPEGFVSDFPSPRTFNEFPIMGTGCCLLSGYSPEVQAVRYVLTMMTASGLTIRAATGDYRGSSMIEKGWRAQLTRRLHCAGLATGNKSTHRHAAASLRFIEVEHFACLRAPGRPGAQEGEKWRVRYRLFT